MTNAERIARGLRKPRKSGDGWVACCPVPAHDDQNPSLSLTDASDGKVLVHDHGGCAQDVVIASLKNRRLWPEHERQSDVIEAVYDYSDERGELLYQIVRKPGKKFLQRYPNSAGGWIWKKHPRQFMYCLL
jgi:hypothetical protein